MIVECIFCARRHELKQEHYEGFKQSNAWLCKCGEYGNLENTFPINHPDTYHSRDLDLIGLPTHHPGAILTVDKSVSELREATIEDKEFYGIMGENGQIIMSGKAEFR
jgi:hypothetical protein